MKPADIFIRRVYFIQTKKVQDLCESPTGVAYLIIPLTWNDWQGKVQSVLMLMHNCLYVYQGKFFNRDEFIKNSCCQLDIANKNDEADAKDNQFEPLNWKYEWLKR